MVIMTMQRRKFVIGLGALAAGGAAAAGTGAFTTAQADRNFNVEVADDADAYLSLEPADTENGDEYTDYDDSYDPDVVEVNLDGDGGHSDGSGVNDNAITEIDDLLKVRNQASDDINISVDLAGSPDWSGGNVEPVEVWANGIDDGTRIDDGEGDYQLGTGSSVNLGIKVDLLNNDYDDDSDDPLVQWAEISADQTQQD